MEYTSGSLRLAKPQLSDVPDITRMNPNWDKIDENISGFNNKINVLSDERGYVNTKITPEQTDFNNVINNGNYWANAWTHKNIPTLDDGTRLTGVMNVYNADSVVYQFFHSNRGKWFREKNAQSWNNWTQLSTPNKTEISLTPKAGFTILNQKNVKINNILYINTEVKKTDDTMFTENQFVDALTLPFSVWDSTLSMIGVYNGFFQVSGSSIGYETHIALVPTKECSSIRVTGEVVL